MELTVDKKHCPQNHRCPAIKVCPVGAIQQSGNGLPKVDQKTCIKCKKCIKFCPMGAIHEE